MLMNADRENYITTNVVKVDGIFSQWIGARVLATLATSGVKFLSGVKT